LGKPNLKKKKKLSLTHQGKGRAIFGGDALERGALIVKEEWKKRFSGGGEGRLTGYCRGLLGDPMGGGGKEKDHRKSRRWRSSG